MMPILLSVLAGAGVHLLYTALAFGWTGLGAPRISRKPRRKLHEEWLVQAGLGEVRLTEFAGVMAAMFVIVAVLAFAVFGAIPPAAILGAFAASAPLVSYRARRDARIARAQEAWPRMIEEIRILTSSLGRSIPQALLEVGRRGPTELRPAFDATRREWLLSTDFDRTIAVLKGRLADPTADAACETLLIAHELGGSDLDKRLEALIEDRILDTQGRKDALAKQAGVRFARRFVLIVPLGMAFAGMSVGDGRAAYQTTSGQLLVLAAIAMVVGCWVWAGQLMKLPVEQRVFYE
ncbi:MAG: type II secretion system F family protein [Acidimicrobiales bacterium]